jgi:hypothetical protein
MIRDQSSMNFNVWRGPRRAGPGRAGPAARPDSATGLSASLPPLPRYSLLPDASLPRAALPLSLSVASVQAMPTDGLDSLPSPVTFLPPSLTNREEESNVGEYQYSNEPNTRALFDFASFVFNAIPTLESGVPPGWVFALVTRGLRRLQSLTNKFQTTAG